MIRLLALLVHITTIVKIGNDEFTVFFTGSAILTLKYESRFVYLGDRRSVFACSIFFKGLAYPLGFPHLRIFIAQVALENIFVSHLMLGSLKFDLRRT